jgi:deoxyribodipyrimidine photo-lyase
MVSTSLVSVFWFRRDLRLDDNAGLYHALKGPNPVLPVFIFDRHILDDLTDKKDARVAFIHQTLAVLSDALAALGTSLLVLYDTPENAWATILNQYKVGEVYTNRDYEPYALEREKIIGDLLHSQQIPLKTYKDHVIFEYNEVLKDNGTPYTVFTPYSKRWKAKLETRVSIAPQGAGGLNSNSYFLDSYPNQKYFSRFHRYWFSGYGY